jgi:hypothetical protein
MFRYGTDRTSRAGLMMASVHRGSRKWLPGNQNSAIELLLTFRRQNQGQSEFRHWLINRILGSSLEVGRLLGAIKED